MKDLTGAVFTDLTVVKYFGRKYDNRDFWYCNCSCGKRNHLVMGKNLRLGAVKRCNNTIHMKGRTEGNKHPFWKGENVGNHQLHRWIRKYFPKPELCRDCKKVPPYDLANISQEYKRDISDWEWLCRKCHMMKDGRLENLIRNRSIRTERNGKGQYV